MENENSVQIEDTAVKATKKPLSRLAKIIITVIVAVVGVGGILAGILVPIALGTREFTDEEGVNPQATIRLSNGMELNFDIYESDCPNAATNFIWLASIGYFNDVILFDSQQGFVRFGGWTDAKKEDGTPVHRGDDDKNFTDKISFSEWTGTDGKVNNYDKNKFGYRLREDTAKSGMVGQDGALSFCYELQRDRVYASPRTRVIRLLSTATTTERLRPVSRGKSRLSDLQAILKPSRISGLSSRFPAMTAPRSITNTSALRSTRTDL